MYLGVRLFMDLYTMVVVSPFIRSPIEGHSNLDRNGETEAS